MAVTFIGLLFVFFECLPVFVKLMSARGPYDHEISNREAVYIHQSDRNRDYEIALEDQTQETRVGAGVAKRKADLTRS